MKSNITIILITVILFGCSKKIENQLPNIVFILADDFGTEVLGCYGGSTYSTPNIDALAETGLKFNQCYSAPLCSPSRVKLLTGRYGFRTGQKWGYIPPNEITFGHLLKGAGYKTAISGKWQMALLKDDPTHIKKMGFDESCVFGWHEGPRYHEPYIYENGEIKTGVKDKYGPNVYVEHLIDFIKKNKDDRFLAYYSMSLPHEISNDMKTPTLKKEEDAKKEDNDPPRKEEDPNSCATIIAAIRKYIAFQYDPSFGLFRNHPTENLHESASMMVSNTINCGNRIYTGGHHTYSFLENREHTNGLAVMLLLPWAKEEMYAGPPYTAQWTLQGCC